MSACLYARGDGTVHGHGKIAGNRRSLAEWSESFEEPWIGAMEATIFTGWIFDFLKPCAAQLKVAHPLMLGETLRVC